MSRSRGPRPVRSATRWPARLKPAPSTQRVVKPSASSSARNASPTRRTPAKFIVPLLMFTTRSSSASAWALRSSTALAMRRSVGVRESAMTAATGAGDLSGDGPTVASAAARAVAAETYSQRWVMGSGTC